MSTQQLIVGRLLCELKGAERIALGPGLPRSVVPYLSASQSWIDLGVPKTSIEHVDVALVEAVEVSDAGDLAASDGTSVENVVAETWIAAGTLRSQHGNLEMVRECTLPVQLRQRVNLVVTELGVIRVGGIGFELLEISPGIASDDIRLQVRASLHVVDDLKRMQLCA